MLRILAILFGLAFIFLGIARYLPQFIENGLIFGYFEIDRVLSQVYIITGIIAIITGLNSLTSRLFFQLIGILYAVIAILGFWRNGNLVHMHVNQAGNVLHLAIGIIALMVGFILRRS